MNYLISVQGRGASYAFMATCNEDEITAKCQPALRAGFECYVYSIEQSPLGQPGFTPTGSLCLRRRWHLYNAHEEFAEEAKSIIIRLDCHSIESSREYLDIMIKAFQSEKEKLWKDYGAIDSTRQDSTTLQSSADKEVTETTLPISGDQTQ